MKPLQGLISSHFLFGVLGLLFYTSCSQNKTLPADHIFVNGTIITMEDSLKTASVLVIKAGKIIAVGDSGLLSQYSCSKDQITDLKGQFLYPGLIDAHCHFYGYAKNLLSCNLSGTNSWQEVLDKVQAFSNTGTDYWIQGRGWDQNDWDVKEFPDNKVLNILFPDRPVVLKRIDGHAVICNRKALEIAGITRQTKVSGGELLLKNGELSGVLIDNAVDLLNPCIAPPSASAMVKALKQAERQCFAYGLTTLADAGLPLPEVLFLDSLGKAGQINIYLYMMLNPDQSGLNYALTKGITETEHSRIGSFKLYADGALGSRGAKLKREYCDRKGHSGLLIQTPSYYDSFCRTVYNSTQYQVNTHCIGDSANRLLLETYARFLKPGNKRLWRIEHAQILDTADMILFGHYGIVPSVQPTHASSDGPWVKDRICSHRLPGAYAYKSLLKQNGWLALGTDFPVEDINPFYTFYSAVFRLNAQKPDQSAFLEHEALSPMEALKGMSIWAARACMLDHRKGSIKPGKDADFVIMHTDLRKAKASEVLKTRVTATYRNGRKVYGN